MSAPAEVVFDRFFRSEWLSPKDRQNYRGKADLSALDPSLRSLLLKMQAVLNEGLRDEKRDVKGHVEHSPFYLDYVESTIPNALAFRHECFSFIGITIPLVVALWESCTRLSRSEAIVTELGVVVPSESVDQLHVLLFGSQLGFVVVHEFTHHVHGHIPAIGLDAEFLNEILGAAELGNLEKQAQEVDSDGYAVYYVL